MKKIISSVLALAMVLCIFPFAGFSLTAFAASESNLTFTLTYDEASYAVSDCDENAFGELVIPSEYNGKSVTEIDDSAFKDCKAITSVTIPDSVTSIGYDAFENCIGLKEISVSPDNSDYSSQNGILFNKDKTMLITYPCGKSETSYTVPSTVVTIREGAFRYCYNITSVTIPDSVTNIYRGAFENCTGLTSVTIPNSVTYISDDTFKGCTGIASITLPDSVTYIGDSAFQDCTGLLSIIISGNVTHIWDDTFKNCTALTSVTIPESVTDIGDNAFNNCNPELAITGYKYSAAYDYAYINGIDFISVGDGEQITYNLNFEGDSYTLARCTIFFQGAVNVPSEYNGKPVTAIDGKAFENCTSLTSVTIPDSVTAIYGSAFAGCTGLTSVTIPDNVTEIDSSAFNYCNPDLVIVTPAYSVAHDYASDNSIKFKLVGKADPLRYEKIWDWGTDDWVYGVKACSSVYSGEIIIPREHKGYSVIEILSGAFEGCTGITSITIPKSVTSVGSDTFRGCTGIKEINVPADASYVDKELFEDTAFYKDDSNWENNVLYICGILVEAKENIAGTCVIKNGTERIAASAFADCTCITSVTIPDGVTYIGCEAFKNCTGLTTVEIPASVTSIEYDAFENCNPDLVIIGSTYSTAHDLAVRKSFKFSSNGTVDPFRYELNEDGESYTLSHCSEALQGDVEVAKEYNGKPVTRIGNSAFPFCKGITAITIPGTVKSIAADSFLYCTELKSVKIQEGVIEIWSRAFWMCDKVESIELPDSLVVVGYQGVYGGSPFYNTAYENNPDNWQDGVLYIGNHLVATKEAEVPADYKIKEGTKTISGYAFSGCENLKSISIPESVVSIGPRAFDESGVKNDRSNWENGVFYVGKHAVSSDKTLVPSDLKIKEGTVSISGLAFENCNSINTVHIPNTVKYIGHSAFLGCEELKSAYIPESVTYIGNAAFGWGVFTQTGYDHDHDAMIYGYEGTEAERSAKSDGNTFVALDVKLADEESGIKVSGNIDEAAALEVKLLTSDKSKITYDITLTKDGKAIQPDGTVTVKIPVPESLDGAKCRVYRVEENGKNTDMNAEFKDGFMVFKTTHFSKYILTTDDLSVVYGDINGDGKINTVDLAMLRKYLANKDPATGESSVSVGAGADVNGDGKINTVDLALLRKYLANKDPVTGESSVTLGPRKLSVD